ncbi:serine/threonine-protein kinase [Streptosporangium sp. KLBMP 9127]|nr:serine/threonine protein kinase [Streptosporangium sp. KLBMP 9127]
MSTNREPSEIGGYRILRRLGQGGMGVVYLAADTRGRRLALKVIHEEWARDAAFRRRFAREVAAARRVARFCTAPVLDADAGGERPYLVTEYVQGPDLGQAVRRHGPLGGADLESLAVGIAVALSAIHGAGVVHRDLKPSNVLLSPTGPRVIDFGIAQLAEPEGLPTRGVIGTPAFMAPEQARGEATSGASDVFAWGALIAFAGTGRLPFGSGAAAEVIYRIVHEEPVLDGLDQRMRALVERATAKRAELRPTAGELLAELVGAPGATPETATQVVEHTWTGDLAAPPAHEPPPQEPPSQGVPAPGMTWTAPAPGAPRPERARRRRLLAAGAVVLAAAVTAAVVWTTLQGPAALPYRETFGRSGDWASGTTEGGVAAYEADGYVLTVNQGWRLWKTAPVGPVGDVLLIADASMPKGAGAYGVWCAGTTGRYDFTVTTDGGAAITHDGRVLAEQAENTGVRARNRIVARCGSRLQLWVNGALAADAEGSRDGEGDVGVIAVPAPRGTAQARFEDFEVRAG